MLGIGLLALADKTSTLVCHWFSPTLSPTDTCGDNNWEFSDNFFLRSWSPWCLFTQWERTWTQDLTAGTIVFFFIIIFLEAQPYGRKLFECLFCCSRRVCVVEAFSCLLARYTGKHRYYLHWVQRSNPSFHFTPTNSTCSFTAFYMGGTLPLKTSCFTKQECGHFSANLKTFDIYYDI